MVEYVGKVLVEMLACAVVICRQQRAWKGAASLRFGEVCYLKNSTHQDIALWKASERKL